jgi:RNA polymerase sigma factor (sigma-70 family)
MVERPPTFDPCIPLARAAARNLGFHFVVWLDCEDLDQEAILAAFKAWNAWNPDKATCAFKTYVWRVVQQHLLDVARRHGNIHRSSKQKKCDMLAWRETGFDRRIEQPWERIELRDTVKRILTVTKRRGGWMWALLQALAAGMTQKEIQKAFGITRDRFIHLRRKLRTFLSTPKPRPYERRYVKP